MLADILVQLKPYDVRLQSKQGIKAVSFKLDANLFGADDARSYGILTFRAQGRKRSGYDDARDAALESLCDSNPGSNASSESGSNSGSGVESFPAQLERRIRKVQLEEQIRGSLYTIKIFVDGEELAGKIPEVSERLRQLPDMVTLQTIDERLVRGKDDSRQSFATLHARFTGTNSELRASIQEITQDLLGKEDQNRGITYDPMFMTHRRRVDVFLKRRIPEKTLVQEVQRQIENVLTPLYESKGHLLIGKNVAVLPTALTRSEGMANRMDAFGREYHRERERIEAQLAEDVDSTDPLMVPGASVAGIPFENLNAARQHWINLQLDFKDSESGKLAAEISALIAAGIDKVSEGQTRIVPNQAEEAFALDVIRYEDQLARTEGSVNEATIKFFNREATDAVVIPALKGERLGDHVLRIAVLDLSTGEVIHEHSYFPRRFRDDLDNALRIHRQ